MTGVRLGRHYFRAIVTRYGINRTPSANIKQKQNDPILTVFSKAQQHKCITMSDFRFILQRAHILNS